MPPAPPAPWQLPQFCANSTSPEAVPAVLAAVTPGTERSIGGDKALSAMMTTVGVPDVLKVKRDTLPRS